MVGVMVAALPTYLFRTETAHKSLCAIPLRMVPLLAVSILMNGCPVPASGAAVVNLWYWVIAPLMQGGEPST